MDLPKLNRPGAWRWFAVYSTVIAVLLIVFAFIGAIESLREWNQRGMRGFDDWLIPALISIACGMFAIPFGLAPWLPLKPWSWAVAIVLIALSLPICCLWPLTVPLLILWVRSETRSEYGVSD